MKRTIVSAVVFGSVVLCTCAWERAYVEHQSIKCDQLQVVTSIALPDDALAVADIGAGALPTDVTVASANIVNGTIVDADIGSAAAIAHTKLAAVAPGYVLVGNASSQAVAVAVSGAVSLATNGVTDIVGGIDTNFTFMVDAATTGQMWFANGVLTNIDLNIGD